MSTDPAPETDIKYDGKYLHRLLVDAAGLDPFTRGLYTKMAELLGIQVSNYNRTINGGRAQLSRIGRICDRFGIRFVWSDGRVQFIPANQAALAIPGGPVLTFKESDLLVIRGDGSGSFVTDPDERKRLETLIEES